MEIAPTSWSVLSAGMMFVLGIIFSIKIGRVFETSSKRALFLYLWHTLFCLVYLFYVTNYGGDATAYYQASSQGGIDFSLGTRAIQFIAMFFSSELGMSVLGVFLSFNLFGFVGLLAFDASIQAAVKEKKIRVRNFATLIVLLPSVSFWSSAIGKDAISFMATGLALWAALNLDRRALLLGLSIALMFVVRPHIAAIMVVAIAASMIIQYRISIVQRVLLGGMALFAAATIVPYAMNYSGLGIGAGASDLAAYVELRQSYNMLGGGAIDIASMSLPMQLFTYLFRPLPFEVDTLPALAASIDNVALLVLVIIGGASMIKRPRSNDIGNRAFFWIFSLGAWLVLAVTTANLGISVRQKWMFAPMLIFLFISVIGRPRKSARRHDSDKAALGIGAKS